MRTVTFILMALMLSAILKASQTVAQESRKEASDQAAKSRLMEVTFRIEGSAIDKAALESIQTILQGIEGVPYVGVGYTTFEVTVRYDSANVSIKQLRTAIEWADRYQAVIVAGSEVVNTNAIHRSLVGWPNVSIECLRHDEAHALCEKHFKEQPPEGIELENCYTMMVYYQAVAHFSSNYDWLSQACLVDENGQLIEPLSWLEFLPGLDETEKHGSGLLIFPKIPLTGVGLTLRLLRANGDGYDSFTVDVPKR